MRKAEVLYKKEVAGILTQLDDGSFIYKYVDTWFQAINKPSISLTLPKNKQEYRSEFLFPFFYNMLPEGSNKQVVCFEMKIDNDDLFGLLLVTAESDTIGAIQVRKTES